MIDYRPSRQILLALLFACAATSLSYGQAPLPNSVLTAIDAAPNRPQIDTFVDALVAKLGSADPLAWGQGRMAIINTSVLPGVSAGFLDQYSDSLNTRLAPLVANKDLRVRLNVAIIAARIASRANNGRLAGTTTKLLHDSSDAVVLWALQAAKYILPPLLQTNNLTAADALGKEVVQAAKGHATVQIAEEAYRALLLDATAGTGIATDSVKNLAPAAITSFVPNTLAFFTFRVKQYADAIPPQPLADTWAGGFFSRPQVWAALTPQLQGQALGSMLDLTKGAATQNATANSPELRDVIRRCGQAFTIVASAMKNSALEKAAKGLSSLSNDTLPEDIQTRVTALEAAVKGLALPVAAAP